MSSNPVAERAVQDQEVAARDVRFYERQVYRYVEAELYAYPWRQQYIERLRADIISATPDRSVGSDTLGNATLSKTMQLLTSRHLQRVVENYEAIVRVYARLDGLKKRLVEMRYWQREYTDYGIYQKLHVSRRTYFRWREEILREMATEMGLL